MTDLFRADNTEGFTAEELALLNAAASVFLSEMSEEDEEDEYEYYQFCKSISDILNNAWTPGVDLETLVRRARRALGRAA